MKKIFVYGDNDKDIIDIIEIEVVPEIIVWRGCNYFINNSELGYGKRPLDNGKDIDDYGGTFFFYYDD